MNITIFSWHTIDYYYNQHCYTKNKKRKEVIMNMNNYPAKKKNIEENLKFDELMKSASKSYGSLAKMQKRHLMEKLIKLAKTSGEIWKVVKFADEIAYALTKNQNKAIISRLVECPDSDLSKVKNYAKETDLALFYLNKFTENEIGKVFT